MQIRSVGIDLGKTTFHLVALGDSGKVLLRKKFTQRQLITFHSEPADVPDRAWKPAPARTSWAAPCENRATT